MKVLYVGKTRKPINDCPIHQHPHYEIVITTSGEGISVVSGKEIPFSAGTILVIPPQSAHENHSLTAYTDMCIQVDKLDFPQNQALVFHDYKNSIIKLTQMLYDNFIQRQSSHADIADGLITCIYSYMVRFHKSTYKYPFVREFIDVLTANLSNGDFSIPQEAKRLGVQL